MTTRQPGTLTSNFAGRFETQMEREAFESPEVIVSQLQSYDDVIGEVLAKIKSAKINGVVICARGSSNNAAVFGKYLIETCLGLTTAIAAPSVSSQYGASLDYTSKLLIVISQSGRSFDLITASAEAKRKGALVIGLVNDEESPLAQLCDVCIPLMAGEEVSVAATKSFVASLSALLILVARWRADSELLMRLPELADYVADCLSFEWHKGVSVLEASQHAYILGRGFGLPVAQEAALKLKETCHILAEAYSAAEFMHGPLTTIKEGHPVVVFAQRDSTYDGVARAAHKLHLMGASIMIVSSLLPTELIGNTLPVAPHPVFESIGMISAFYPLVARMARRRGLNPDMPPHISKVTVTS